MSSTGCVTDLELVELARAGDDDAFGELVVRHHRAALRAAAAALGSPAEADDAVQEAWMAARARLRGFRGDAAFRTWFLTIVWNKARDRRRSLVGWMKRMVAIEPNEPGEGGSAAMRGGAALVARSGSPEAALLGGETSTRIRQFVRALPPKLRDPLLLIGSGEYTYEEVAAILRQPTGTVKWRVSEARRQIREKLERLGLQ